MLSIASQVGVDQVKAVTSNNNNKETKKISSKMRKYCIKVEILVGGSSLFSRMACKVVSVLPTSTQGGMGYLLPPLKCSAYSGPLVRCRLRIE